MRRAGRVVTALARRSLTVVTAESCTAGLIAAALSEGEGASRVLQGGFVTYTKDQKHKALGVPKSTLARDGAVTADVARKLAAGALKHAKAALAVAVTGVLGPEPDEDGNPVGLVYVTVLGRSGSALAVKRQFRKAPHDELRRKTVLLALDLLARAARTHPAPRRTRT